MPTGMHEHTHPSTSEFWLNGEMCSRAELIRSQMKQGKLQDEVNKAAIERSQAGYDAGHWYWQPVGGRAVRCPLLFFL